MFQHSLLIAIRNLKRHKGSFIINLIGLSTGLACTFLIYLWVTDELNFDKFHAKHKQLYQVMELSKENGNTVVHDGTQGPLSEAMTKDLPEVVSAVAVMPMERDGIVIPLRAGEKVIKGSGLFAGKDFFNVFSFPLIEGKPANVLQEKSSIVLSERMAKVLYGSAAEAVGKNLDWEIFGKKIQAMVTGVFADLPANNSLKFDFALTYDIVYRDIAPNLQKWWNEGPYTYLLLKEGTDVDRFNAKIKDYLKKYYGETIFTLFVRPYSSGYLYGKYENGVQSGGRIEYVRLFSVVAIFILFIACINFMNLSTAKASRRLKEVGIKKAVGSTRRLLIFQFLSEAVFMAFLSLLVACVVVALILPVFNEVTGKDLQINMEPRLVLLAIGITLITGLISGSYPAFYMSGFDVVSVFRGRVKKSLGELMARKGLVVFQFMVSLVLMIAVMVIYKQIQYAHSKNVGYDRSNIVYFEKDGKVTENSEAFIAELKKLPGVLNASAMQQNLFQNRDGTSTYGIQWPGKTDKDLIDFVLRAVDYDMLETLGIQVKEGRSFSKQFGAEDTKLIFNEAAIRAMRLKDPVGTKVTMWGNDMTIAGVVKDFHMSSFHEEIAPMVFMYSPQRTSTVMAKIAAGKEKQTLSAIADLYKKFNPGYLFEYKFLDEAYQAQYTAEQRVSVLSRYFAGLAIIISCLGLFGLAAFNAEVRTKEIGIRKVLGASLTNVMLMLSKDFIQLIIISMLIAFPIAWWAMNEWLNSFAYRVEVGVFEFVVAGVSIIVLAMITVSYQSIKTALMNPVKSLKTSE